ncbi:restriction endonuclease subunit S, partial [Gardnerella leopoldii]
LTAELTAELTARKKQYEYYRDTLLTFDDNNPLHSLIQRYFPNGVEHKKLGDIAIRISDGMHNLPKGISLEGEYPVLSAQNINNGFISVETSKWVTKEIFDVENKRTNVSENDVLLTIVGAIGRVAVVESDIKALFQRSVCVIKPNPDTVISKFLYHILLSSNIQNYMAANAHGAAQKGLYLKQVSGVTIPIPPLEVQRQIVQILDRFDALCNDLTQGLPAEIEARRKQYEYYRDQLLTFKRA